MARKWQLLSVVAVMLVLLAPLAFGTDTATGLAWETPFQKFRDSITGPIAFGMSFLALVIAGLVLIYGGEVYEFIRRMVFAIFVVSLLMFANNILSFLFAGGASVFPPPLDVPAVVMATAPAGS